MTVEICNTMYSDIYGVKNSEISQIWKVFIRPSLRRDILWYTTVRPSVSHVTL
jgi:hypothetical protein